MKKNIIHASITSGHATTYYGFFIATSLEKFYLKERFIFDCK